MPCYMSLRIIHSSYLEKSYADILHCQSDTHFNASRVPGVRQACCSSSSLTYTVLSRPHRELKLRFSALFLVLLVLLPCEFFSFTLIYWVHYPLIFFQFSSHLFTSWSLSNPFIICFSFQTLRRLNHILKLLSVLVTILQMASSTVLFPEYSAFLLN